MCHSNIERSSQSSIVTPKYNALCGMAKCYVMNPLNGMMHQIRVSLDSRANLSLINNDVARKIGLPCDTVNINLNVAGGGVVTKHVKEVSFQLVIFRGQSI